MSPASLSGVTLIELLGKAEQLERAGTLEEAAVAYDRVAELARGAAEHAMLSRALRRLAVLRHRLSDNETARSLCESALHVAIDAREHVLAAEALNVRAGLEFEAGKITEARQTYREAVKLGGADRALRARIQQNLGILANVQGDLDSSAAHYRQSLEAYSEISDNRGCGLVYHNLGMLSADREEWVEAEDYFRRSRAIAVALGDMHLEALCALNQAEVYWSTRRYDLAMSSAEAALRAFESAGSRTDKSDAYRLIGMVYRDTGKLALAEARLTHARDLAQGADSMLSEAEATRELALVMQAMGRNQDALTLLTRAYKLFTSLDARLDLVDVGAKRERLEETYLEVVREWGQSIESSDSYTFGHCSRVAEYAVAVAAALGLDEHTRTTIHLGAYLHDLGKIKVPHEILNKPGRLTADEFEIIKKHPVWGVELLENVEFPWDIKPIIRWHHERYDGTGYPDQLKGDEIPVSAQILCIADVYDALTTTRSYRPALSHEVALERMAESQHWWRDDVYAAFMSAVGDVLREAA